MSNTDKSIYAPFILKTGLHPSLSMSDKDMSLRESVFEERKDEGWSGNGYDWTSIAPVIIGEKLPDLEGRLQFDPEAGMFSAIGPIEALEHLGAEMKRVFDDENLLRNVLSHAELD